MSRSHGVIGMAASGITTRSTHVHWHEVNPIRTQARDKDKDWQDYVSFRRESEKFKKRLATAIKNGARILY